MKRRIALVLLILTVVCLACGETSSDDDDDETSDADTSPDADDDTIDGDDSGDDDDDFYADLQPSGASIGEMIGIAAQLDADPENEWKRDFEFDTLAEMGIFHTRAGFSWKDVEPENDLWTWDHTDVYHDIIRERGVIWNARLAYTTDWAAPDGSPSEIDPVDFADYAWHVADRYCEDVKRYEIWNEPNLYHFWEPTPDPEHYGRLLKAAATAVREACPDAEVVFGGLSSTNWPQEWNFGTYTFFDRVAAAHPDVCDYFDTMAIHPYTILQLTRPEHRIDWDPLPVLDVRRQVDDIRTRMTAAGCSDKSLLFSEFGWPHTYLGMDAQAAYIIRALLLGMSKDVSGFYLYTFWDKTRREPVTENHFGLFEYPESTNPEAQSPKPGYFALRHFMHLLGPVRYAGDLAEKLELPLDVYAFAFLDEENARLIIVSWDGRGTGEGFTLELPLPDDVEAIEVVGIDGQQLDIPVARTVSLTLTGAPVYVEFTLGR